MKNRIEVGKSYKNKSGETAYPLTNLPDTKL